MSKSVLDGMHRERQVSQGISDRITSVADALAAVGLDKVARELNGVANEAALQADRLDALATEFVIGFSRDTQAAHNDLLKATLAFVDARDQKGGKS